MGNNDLKIIYAMLLALKETMITTPELEEEYRDQLEKANALLSKSIGEAYLKLLFQPPPDDPVPPAL